MANETMIMILRPTRMHENENKTEQSLRVAARNHNVAAKK